MNKAAFALAAVAAVFIISCNKEAVQQKNPPVEPEPKEVTKENLSGAYAITKVETQASGQRSDMTDDWFGTYAGDCAKDDVTTFKPDGSFVVIDGTVECTETTDDAGTWSIIDATHIRIDSDTTTIEAFNSTTLRIISPVYSSAQGQVIFTYTRQ